MGELIRFALSLVAVAVCLTPIWIYLLVNWLFEPHGFWQNIFLAGVGIYFLGAAQLVLLVVLAILLFLIWIAFRESMR